MTTNGTERLAAASEWLAAAAAGQEMTGAQLGERFGRSPGWGRGVIREARAEHEAMPPVAAAPERQERGETLVTAGGVPPLINVDVVDNSPDRGELAEPLPRHAARRPWPETAIVLVVAAVAAAASYGHMAHVAALAGEPLWLARAFPITVDGLVVAALRRGEAGRRWLVLGLAVSVAANVLGQFPETAAQAGPVVAAWPPLALFGTHRLLSGNDRHG